MQTNLMSGQVGPYRSAKTNLELCCVAASVESRLQMRTFGQEPAPSLPVVNSAGRGKELAGQIAAQSEPAERIGAERGRNLIFNEIWGE